MRFKKTPYKFGFYLSVGMSLCFISCDSSDGNSSPSEPPTFQAGFNPEHLEINTQLWMINNTNNSNIVASIITANTVNYDYTTFGKKAESDNANFVYDSLGISATLNSSFNFTDNQSVYDALTTQLANPATPLSIAVAAFDVSNPSTSADVLDAANNASPNLILFYDNGNFYTLDSLELTTNNNDQATQILNGSPISFSGNVASKGFGATKTQTNSVTISYLTPLGV